MTIIDTGDKIAFKNELGHDVAWGCVQDECSDEEAAEFNNAFEVVKWGDDYAFHTDGDTYQGSTMMRVIRRKADGKLFGFSFWEGGGKYGETYIESNGDDHGFESKYDWDDDVAEEEVWYVFTPVKEVSIPAYVFESD